MGTQAGPRRRHRAALSRERDHAAFTAVRALPNPGSSPGDADNTGATPRRGTRSGDLTRLGVWRSAANRLLVAFGFAVGSDTLRLAGVQLGETEDVPASPEREEPPSDFSLLTIWRSETSRLLMSAAAAFSLLLIAVGFAAHNEALRLVGVFGALIFGAGAAPCQLASGPSLGERCGIAIMLGLSGSSLIGAVMVLAPLWNPLVATVLVVVAAAIAHTIGVRRSLGALKQAGLPLIGRLSTPRQPRSVQISAALTAIGTALWVAAAIRLGHLTPVAAGGFLRSISYAWYAGLLLLIAAIVLAREGGEVRIALPVFMLIAAVTVTPAIVYGEPDSQSAVKHVLLIQHILQVHRLHPNYLYYAFSGFFDGMAWLCQIMHVANPIGLATYWPALVGILGAIELRFLLGRVIASSRRCWIGVLIATLADSVGQNYFSPQAEAFVIALGALAIVIIGRHELATSRAARLAFLLVAGLALAITHELTPYIAGGVLVVLGLFRVVNPRWAALAILVPAGAWAGLHLHALAGFVSLSHLGELTNFKPPPTIASPGLGRQAIVGISTDALVGGLLVLVALALIGLARNFSRGGAWGFIVSAGVGLVFVTVNPYGNEGIFRATLFAIPWLVLMGLAAVRKAPWRWAALAVLSTVLLACYLVSSFGLDPSNVVRASDVAVLDAYVQNAPPGSYHLEIAESGDLPTTLDPTQHSIPWSALWDAADAYQAAVHSILPPKAADLKTLTVAYVAYAYKFGHTPPANLFAVYSTAAENNSDEYGVETPANSREWLQLFLNSRSWRLIYASDGSYLFRYVPPVPKATRV